MRAFLRRWLRVELLIIGVLGVGVASAWLTSSGRERQEPPPPFESQYSGIVIRQSERVQARPQVPPCDVVHMMPERAGTVYRRGSCSAVGPAGSRPSDSVLRREAFASLKPSSTCRMMAVRTRARAGGRR